MGEEITTTDHPSIEVEIQGTDVVKEVVIVRDGVVLHSLSPGSRQVKFTYSDESFQDHSYYYLRVTQGDTD